MNKSMKVFDCQLMPQKMQDIFFKRTEGHSNDCYLKWYVAGLDDDGHTIIDEWLVDNGAKYGKDVLIKHWW